MEELQKIITPQSSQDMDLKQICKYNKLFNIRITKFKKNSMLVSCVTKTNYNYVTIMTLLVAYR
jgi:hypothetical protein